VQVACGEREKETAPKEEAILNKLAINYILVKKIIY
jgi:hypothetical protein